VDAGRYGRGTPFRLRLTASSGDEVARLAVGGEVDMSTVDDLADVLCTIIRTGRARRVVVDLAEVGFLASAGIAALVNAYQLAQERQMKIVVVNCRPAVTRVMEITGVDKFLTSDEAPPP